MLAGTFCTRVVLPQETVNNWEQVIHDFAELEVDLTPWGGRTDPTRETT